MHQVKKSALVQYSAKQMFSLVNDFERYPEFLQGCSGAAVLSIDGNHLKARLEISKGPIHQSFETLNTIEPYKSIHMKLNNGPFKFLEGRWQFTPLSDDACKIDFELSFEFSNAVLSMTFSSAFKHMVENMMQAFLTRAKQLGHEYE